MKDITAYVRAYAVPEIPPANPNRWIPKPGWRPQLLGERVLVFDLETVGDPSQRCSVGNYRIYCCAWKSYEFVEEGLIQGDGLSPIEQRRLRYYRDTRNIPLLTRGAFCRLLIREGYDLGTLIAGFSLPFDLCALSIQWGKGRKRWKRGFRVRLLRTAYEPPLQLRKIGPTATLIQWGSYGIAKIVNGKRIIVGRREPRGRGVFVGRFLDLLDACAALWWGKKLTLHEACRNVGIELPQLSVDKFGTVTPRLIERCRRDVELTWQLFLAVRDEVNRHPALTPIPSPRLHPGARAEDTPDLRKGAHLITRMHSVAALGKAYWDEMGLRPRLELQRDFPRDVLGHAMAAFFGGRTETRYPETVLPVASLDILATYLSVNVLMGLWEWDTAARIDVEDATDETRELLSSLTVDDLFRPETWKRLYVLCLIEPNGDYLPVRLRGQPGDAPTLHMKRVYAESGAVLAYMLPDLIGSWLETGRTPRIARAWRFVPKGRQPNLRSVLLRGELELDPSQDVFNALRDARLDLKIKLARAKQDGQEKEALELARREASLKLLGEALSYGVSVEVDENDLGAKTAKVWGLEHFTSRIAREEYPGRFFFAPRGALVTAGARLLVAMMERLGRDAGGDWATIDTDSITILSTKFGGFIPCPGGPHRLPDGSEAVRALPHAEIQRLVDRFIPLSLLPRRSLWKWEDENSPHPDAQRDSQLYIIAAGLKKYALFNVADDGRVILRKLTETALGHLVPPAGYMKKTMIDALWEAKVQLARGDADAFSKLPFANSPALGRLPITTPDLLRRLRVTPRGARKVRAPHPTTPRPFGFFSTAIPHGGIAVFSGDVYWHGWCRLHHRESLGCPPPHRECPYRARCELAHPVRPITFDSPTGERWYRVPWIDHYTGRALQMAGVSTEMDHAPRISAQSFADLGKTILTHEPRIGLDDESDVRITRLQYTGREARHLEEVGAALLIPEETVLVYQPDDPGDDTLRQALHGIPVAWMVNETGLSRRTIQRYHNGHTSVYPANRKILWLAVAQWQQRYPSEASP